MSNSIFDLVDSLISVSVKKGECLRVNMTPAVKKSSEKYDLKIREIRSQLIKAIENNT